MNSYCFRRFWLVLSCLSLALFGGVTTQTVRGQDPGGYQNGCGNDDDDDNDDPCACQNSDDSEPDDSDAGDDDDTQDCDETGANPINPYRANVHREVTDIATFGPAPIQFTRAVNSRNSSHGGFNNSYWELGYRQIWQHNWNYEMRNQGTVSNNTQYILLRYPNGSERDFRPLSYPVTVGSQLVPVAWSGDRLYVTALSTGGAITACTILTAAGEELDFQRSTAPDFHLIQKRNGLGFSWTCTYSASGASGRLTRITNNFGRWIQIDRDTGGGSQPINQVSTSDGRVVTYNYSAWAAGTVVLSSVDYPGGEHATYTHVTSDASLSTARPLIATADDPTYRHGKPGAHIEYLYNADASYPDSHGFVPGTLLEERNGLTDQTIIKFPLGSGAYPQILEGDGTEIVRKYTHGRLTTKRDGEGRDLLFTRGQ